MSIRDHYSVLMLRGSAKRSSGRGGNRDQLRHLVFEQMEDRRLLATIDLATWTAAQGSTIFGVDSYDQSGFSVSSAGDLNGDGFDDLIIGARSADGSANGKYNSGDSYVIFGGALLAPTIELATLGTPGGSAGITIVGAADNDQSGISVSGAGDVNGDGFDDLIIGARSADAAGNNKDSAGDSYVIFGGPSMAATIDLAALGTPGGAAGITIFGADASDQSGISVSNAGDVNGDGFSDVLIGARYADAAGNLKLYSGDSYVVFGGALLPATIDLAVLGTPGGSAGITLYGADPFDQSGYAVSSAGDVNGDGFDDLIIGARSGDASGNGKYDAGDSYLIFGGASLNATIDLAILGTPGGSAGTTLVGADTEDQSGISVSGAGDVNGDGFDDLIVGAHFADAFQNTASLAGDAYVIFGSAALPSTIDLSTLGTASGLPGITIFGVDPNDRLGISVNNAGDVNGDGFDDLIIGANQADAAGNGKSLAGESYVIFGSSLLPATLDVANLGSAGITIFGKDVSDNSGRSVSSAGDVDGDGFDDLLIGAFVADALNNLILNAGESYLIFGGNSFTASVTGLGTEAAETLTGTSAVDIMVAGRGSDTLIGNGNADVLIGGQGNDVLAVSDMSFRRIVGGAGSDILRLDGSGLSLNLTTLPDNRLFGIEQIDITGNGNNTLTFNQREVLNLSEESNTLTVRRQLGDVINIGSGWTQGPNQTIGLDVFSVFTQGAATLRVLAVNEPAVVGSIGPAVTYVENAVPVAVFPSATIIDPDSLEFGGGSMTISNPNGQSSDLISIRQNSLITLAGANVNFNGLTIGSFSGGAGTTDLVIAFNALAYRNRAQFLLNSIAFSNASELPSTLARTISVRVNDGDGGLIGLFSKSVNVTSVNDLPVIGSIGAGFTYVENAPPIAIFPSATVSDLDSTDFGSGTLTISNLAGQSSDLVSILPNGLIGLSGTNVTFNGTSIGTFIGGAGTTALVVSFNTLASSAHIQILLNSVVFSNVSELPNAFARSISVRVNDGDGGQSNLLSKSVNVTSVNDLPVIGSIGATITYLENAVPIAVFPTATVVDPDSLEFGSGSITISNPSGQSTDLISIRPNSLIGLSGTNVVFNGTTIGTFAGGAGTTALVVSLNTSAYPNRVQALLNAIAFSNSSEQPNSVARAISVRVNDGDGGQSNLASKSVNVTSVIDVPLIGAVGPTVTYVEDGLPVAIFPTATVTDLDSLEFGSGSLIVSKPGGQTSDLIAIRPTALVTLSGSNVLFNGSTIGTFSGGSGTTPLVVSLNALAYPNRVQALLNTIVFSNSIQFPSVLPRSVSVQINDGHGGVSALVSKSVNVTSVNDAPVLAGIAGGINYTRNAAPIILASTATLSDVDDFYYSNGKFTAQITNGGSATNRLAVGGTLFIVDATNRLLRNGVHIGSLNSGGGIGLTKFEIVFNSGGTSSHVQELIRDLRFSTVGETVNTSRVIAFTVTDPLGANTAALTKTVTLAAGLQLAADLTTSDRAVAIAFAETVTSPRQSPIDRFDVNEDGAVSPLDVLVVINALRRYGNSVAVQSVADQAESDFDVDGDFYLTPLDALQVINHMNRRSVSGEGNAKVADVASVGTDAGSILHEESRPVDTQFDVDSIDRYFATHGSSTK